MILPEPWSMHVTDGGCLLVLMYEVTFDEILPFAQYYY